LKKIKGITYYKQCQTANSMTTLVCGRKKSQCK